MSEVKKDERYIKSVLAKVFKNAGNFQQFEFNSGGGSSRRDFVILGDDYFHYYEIKTEKDSFVRLPSQISNAVGLFTKMYIVAPLDKIGRLWKMGVATGFISFEGLKNNVERPFQEQKVAWRLSIEKVMEVLWANDLRNFINEKKPGIKGLSRTNVGELQKIFLAHYTDKDCLKILNEILPNRDYDFRRHNQQLKSSD